MAFETAALFDLRGPRPGLPLVADRAVSLLGSWRRGLRPAPFPLPAIEATAVYGFTVKNFLNPTWEVSKWRCHRHQRRADL
jgi:hypothetical protein